jgi:hypothetical protein
MVQPARTRILMPMLTPIVTEVPRAIEPVVHDTFIREYTGRVPREQGLPANVVRLSTHRSRRRRSAVVPARVA